MLLLGRKKGEWVRFTLPDGRFGWVVVADIERGKCRLGFELPHDVTIARNELLPEDQQHRKE